MTSTTTRRTQLYQRRTRETCCVARLLIAVPAANSGAGADLNWPRAISKSGVKMMRVWERSDLLESPQILKWVCTHLIPLISTQVTSSFKTQWACSQMTSTTKLRKTLRFKAICICKKIIRMLQLFKRIQKMTTVWKDFDTLILFSQQAP